MGENKKIIGILIGIIIIIFLIPILLSYNIKDSSVWGVVLNYIGTILGGFLTLLGVYYTIKESNKDKKIELELLYRPQIKVKEEKNNQEIDKDLILYTEEEGYSSTDFQFGKTVIEITNIGRGEMLNVLLKDIKIDSIPIVKNMKPFFLNEEKIDYLGIKDSIYIEIGIPTYKNRTQKRQMIYTISFIVEYNGILNNTTFQNEISFSIANDNQNRNKIYNFKVKSLDYK